MKSTYTVLLVCASLLSTSSHAKLDFSRAELDQESGLMCVIKEETVDKIEKEPILECTHKTVEKCHYTYITQFTPSKQQVCNEMFEKICHVTFKQEAVKDTVRKCYRPLEKVCNGQGKDICQTLFESSCSTRYTEKSPGKFVGNTTCEKLPVKVCGAGCIVEEGEEECHDKVVTSVVQVPQETCDLNPQKVCKMVTKMVPRLSPKHECTQVPREVCHVKFSPPKLIKKPLITKWCLEKEKSLSPVTQRPRVGKKLCSPQQEDCACQHSKQCTKGQRCISQICKSCDGATRPPLTFVVDTTGSVKKDKDSIFQLSQRTVKEIVRRKIKIPSYQLVTFNDVGETVEENVEVVVNTSDVVTFKEEITNLRFHGGEDSIERMTQGLLTAVATSPPGALVVVFTDDGSKDLELAPQIIEMKKSKDIEIFTVLTPRYKGDPKDDSLKVYGQFGEVFDIGRFHSSRIVNRVAEFEQQNCV